MDNKVNSDEKHNVFFSAQHHQKHTKVRLHHFPPLRKPWMITIPERNSALEPADYQKHLVEGFQEGINKGYEKGFEQGKEEGYHDGLKNGYEDGLNKGKEEGRQIGEKLFLAASEPLDDICHQLRMLKDDLEKKQRTELLKLVEKIATQVIHCELDLKPTQLLSLIDEALAGMPEKPEKLKVAVNPDTYTRLNEVAPEKIQQWGVVADANLALGECRLNTDKMEIDVGCQHRLEQCMDALKQNLLPDEVHE